MFFTMVFLKYFLLLLLGICGLCHADSEESHPSKTSRCSQTSLWGTRSPYSYKSEDTIIPPGLRNLKLLIPNGYKVCQFHRKNKYFVGEEVVVCDYDYLPTVEFVNHNHNAALVTRNGLLQQQAIAYVTYYCDKQPTFHLSEQ